MTEFTFEEKQIPISIAGQQFTLQICDTITESILKMGEDMEKTAKSGILSAKTIEKLCRRYMDTILGNGAYDRIFTGGQRSYLDKLDVLIFVAETYRDEKQKRVSSFLEKAANA